MPDLLVVGPGAIGGVLACRWAEAGRRVALLGRTPASEAALLRAGFEFTGTTGNTRRVRRGLFSGRRSGTVEAAFVCVKSHHTAKAAAALAPRVGPDTPVVALQNGLGHEKVLRRAFGPRRTVIGICYIAADRLAPGKVSHNGGKDVHLARTKDNAAAVAAAKKALESGGWTVTIDADEDAMLWTKLCFNAAGNPLGALCGAANGELARDPALRELLLRALREALEAARADGHAVPTSDMETLMVKPYPNDSKQRNSMLQDLTAGRRTEIGAIVGPILAAAKRRRVKLTLLPQLDRFVRRLEAAL